MRLNNCLMIFSEKAILKAERELQRYQKEREQMEEQLKVANDDVASISMLNIELKSAISFSCVQFVMLILFPFNFRSTPDGRSKVARA